jgi:hypothetical protein
MLETVIRRLLEHFSLAMLVLAIVVALGWYVTRGRHAGRSLAEELFRWVALLGLGLPGLYTFVMHVFFPRSTAEEIGWATSPFQYEVGMADLTIGVLGVLAFRASLGFRLATTVAAVCWLGGDAVGHVRQMIIAQNFAPGNAGSWFWTDVLVPVIMVALLATLGREECRAHSTKPPAVTSQAAHPAF